MYESNSNTKISPASLTKLMTALILYEANTLNKEIITKLPSDYSYSGKVAYIENGTVLTTEELLELLLVYSANDAAYVAAMEISNSVDDFIKLMNLKARELNMDDTIYLNPDGLDEIGHETTLNDLLILSIYIIENTKILNITSKKEIYINTLPKKTYNNTNLLIDEGFDGLKTGWTSQAGLTFIGFNQIDGRRILTIVNKSFVDEKKNNHFLDTNILYTNSVNDFQIKKILSKNYVIYKINNSEFSTNYHANKELNSFVRTDTKIYEVVEIKNNQYALSFNDIELETLFKIPSSNYKVNYQFHWSNRFLSNLFDN